MMPNIELIYDRGCPNTDQTRGQLIEALSHAGWLVHWQEWCRKDPETPEYVQQYGSPTILVNGQDIEPNDITPTSCRLYIQSDGSLSGVPPVATIINALNQTKHTGFDLYSSSAWLPAVGIAFLPKLICPACWPAYAAIVGAVGLSFLTQVQYLLPITAIVLLFMLALLAWQGPVRHGYGPLLLALVSSAGLLMGKFYYDATSVAYISGVLLFVACIWHSWPASVIANQGCPYCVEQNPDMKEET